jgi:hypothetical protein
MPIVLKTGSLKLLEPSGPAQACNGIALPCFTLLPRDWKRLHDDDDDDSDNNNHNNDL